MALDGVSITLDAYISGASASESITVIFPFSDSFLSFLILSVVVRLVIQF